jgi:hypothetical protein
MVANGEHHIDILGLHRRGVGRQLIGLLDRLLSARQVALGAVIARQCHPRRDRLRVMFTCLLPQLLGLFGIFVAHRQRGQSLQCVGIELIARQHIFQILAGAALIFVLHGQARQIDPRRMKIGILGQGLLIGRPRLRPVANSFQHVT